MWCIAPQRTSFLRDKSFIFPFLYCITQKIFITQCITRIPQSLWHDPLSKTFSPCYAPSLSHPSKHFPFMTLLLYYIQNLFVRVTYHIILLFSLWEEIFLPFIIVSQYLLLWNVPPWDIIFFHNKGYLPSFVITPQYFLLCNILH